MALIKVKGNDIHTLIIKDSATRRAQQFKNNIMTLFKKMGVTEDDVDLILDRIPTRKAPASVAWYYDGYYLFYSYGAMDKYVENLYVVFRVIESQIDAFLSKEISKDEFIENFYEKKDVLDQRKEARRLLEVDDDCMDLEVINKQYKKLAKDAHPDMPKGSEEKFKHLNHAHKLLKKELS